MTDQGSQREGNRRPNQEDAANVEKTQRYFRLDNQCTDFRHINELTHGDRSDDKSSQLAFYAAPHQRR